VPLALNVTPVGPDVTAHVYVRCDSPPSSAPRTVRSVVVPVVTGFGEAAAALAMVGASFWMVTLAVPWRPEPGSVAVTVKGPPPLAPAVKSPLGSMLPPPAVQPNAGCDVIAFPNWSFSVAAKACVAFGSIVAEPGLTVTLVA